MPNMKFRALTEFTKLACGQQTFAINDSKSVPHLREGEFAVVDTTDRELQNGELYLIQFDTGDRARSVLQARLRRFRGRRSRTPVWWITALRGFHRTNDSTTGVPVYAGLSDGPYESDHLQSKVIGRIVGFASSPLGAMIAPAAGYENEAAANAAFDPVEYVDMLLNTGHDMYVVCDKHGEPKGRYETVCPLSDTDNRAVNAVREKLDKASTGADRVAAECVRRGLVRNLPPLA